MRILLIEVVAPCDFINSNDRRHHLAKAKLTRAWREAGREAVHALDAAGNPPMPFEGVVHITAHIWKVRGGRWDVLNLWPTLKAAIDGVVESGLIPDDDWEHVIGPDMRRGGKGSPRIVIRIEEVR